MKATMRKTTLVLILGLTSSAMALSPIGPTQSILEKDQWGTGINLGFQSMDLVADGTIYEYPPSPAATRATQGKIALNDIETVSSLAQIGFGLSEAWDIYGCIGVVGGKGNATVNRAGSPAGTQAFQEGESFDINGDHELAWGFGTRFTLKDEETLKWGGMAQMTWQKPKGSTAWTAKNDPSYLTDGTWELDYWELIVAFGPTFVYDNVEFYGGPFLHLVRGDLSLDATTSDPGRAGTNLDLEEEALVGAYAGMQMDLYENMLFYVDGQFTGKAWGVGLGTILRTE